MREHLTGIEARDRGISELCRAIAPDGYRVAIPPTPTTLEDLGARSTPDGPVDADGTPLWIYGAALPRDLVRRATKVQVHESFDLDEAPSWFDHRFPAHIRDTSVPGHSCFSRRSLSRATASLLDGYRGVRLKDPNGASGVGQYIVRTIDDLEPALRAAASDVETNSGTDLDAYLAEHGYVVEAEVEHVEAWSITVTRTPDGCYSSFGRLVEQTVDTVEQGVIPNYGGTSLVVVRGDPEALADLPADGVTVEDPLAADEVRLTPPSGVVHAAQRYIEGLRRWEADGVIETRANVDVISGTLTTRTGGQDEIIAAIEDSGRAGGASPAELLGILALRTDPTLTHVTRSTRHSFDDTARAYADRVASIPGSRVFWSGIDHGFDGKFVFIGVF